MRIFWTRYRYDCTTALQLFLPVVLGTSKGCATAYIVAMLLEMLPAFVGAWSMSIRIENELSGCTENFGYAPAGCWTMSP